jgi:hypothetical protein
VTDVAVLALVSAKGSPGVTSTALALTLTRTSPVILAECDPSGGSVLPGFLRGQLGADRGLVPLAAAELRGESLASDFWSHLVDFDPPHRHRLLLPGAADPAQAGSLAPVWGRLAEFLTALEVRHGYDVVADCGRLAVPHPPLPVLYTADLVLLVLRPELPSVSAAAAALRTLRSTLAGAGPDTLGLAVVGDGEYGAGEIGRQLGVPVRLTLPADDRSARALTLGGTVRHGWPLLKAAARSEPDLRSVIARRHPQVTQRSEAEVRTHVR